RLPVANENRSLLNGRKINCAFVGTKATAAVLGAERANNLVRFPRNESHRTIGKYPLRAARMRAIDAVEIAEIKQDGDSICRPARGGWSRFLVDRPIIGSSRVCASKIWGRLRIAIR